jgi:glycine cleavage system H protein
MEIPQGYRFTKEHEWIRVEGTTALVGISEFAQRELGDVIFVELPEIGSRVNCGAVLCVVESTKAASDVYAPIGGVVSEINETLKDSPEMVNNDPYNAGWLVKLNDFSQSELAALMSDQQYLAFLESH